MRITAKVDYAVRAVAELAAVQLQDPEPRATKKAEALATAQEIPVRFLEGILAELRRSGIVGSQYPPSDEVSVADVIRAVEGPLADVHGEPPEEVGYGGVALPLQRVWIATRAALRSVLETTSMADVVRDELPPSVQELVESPGGWTRR